MQHDPLYQYILLNIPRRRRDTTMPPFMPLEFTRDPLNLHDDDRRAWRAPEPPRAPAQQRLGRVLVRLGRWVEGRRATPPPFDTAPTRRPTTTETAP